MTVERRRKKKPITFGPPREHGALQVRAIVLPMPRISDDVRLFAITFASGFLFTALFIA